MTGSSALRSIVSAPRRCAAARREGIPSSTITRPAPCLEADSTANNPTGPAPNTATVFPSPTSASFAPNQAVGKMSETVVAWSSVTDSGTFTGPTCANG